MNGNVAVVKGMYEAFGRGDIPAILNQLNDDAIWSFEGNDKISWSGVRRVPPKRWDSSKASRRT
jgi:ketosteroid isomerase-like protein